MTPKVTNWLKRYVLYNRRPTRGPIYISVCSKFELAVAHTHFDILCSNFVCVTFASGSLSFVADPDQNYDWKLK
jgi:hypothetical protein